MAWLLGQGRVDLRAGQVEGKGWAFILCVCMSVSVCVRVRVYICVGASGQPWASCLRRHSPCCFFTLGRGFSWAWGLLIRLSSCPEAPGSRSVSTITPVCGFWRSDLVSPPQGFSLQKQDLKVLTGTDSVGAIARRRSPGATGSHYRCSRFPSEVGWMSGVFLVWAPSFSAALRTSEVMLHVLQD